MNEINDYNNEHQEKSKSYSKEEKHFWLKILIIVLIVVPIFVLFSKYIFVVALIIWAIVWVGGLLFGNGKL